MQNSYYVPFFKANIIAPYIYTFRYHFIDVEDRGCIRIARATHHDKDTDVDRVVEAKFVRELSGLYTFVSVKEIPNDDEFICDNCHEIKHEDEKSDNDFLTSGGNESICQECINNGYGR